MRQDILGACLINELGDPSTPKTIGESNGRPIIESKLMTGEMLNRNNRFYNSSEIKAEVYSSRTKELLVAKTMLGEAGHPITTDITRQSSIDPKCISHNILDMWMDADTVYGKITGTPNEYGDLFSNLIREGSQLAFSLRALGTIIKTEKGMQVKNPKMITFDWVIYPSFKNAYQTKVLNENANFSKTESGLYLPNNKLVVESTGYDPIIPIKMNDTIEKYILDESKNLKDIISQMEIVGESYELANDGQFLVLTEAGTNNQFKILLETKVTNDILDYYGRI